MPSAPSFNPSPTITDEVLTLCTDPALTLNDIAARHNTTLEALTLFLFRPDIAERLESLYAAAAIRTRFLAAHLIPSAIDSLAKVLDEYDNLTEAARTSPPAAAPSGEASASASHPTSDIPHPTSHIPHPTSLRQRIRETTRRAATRILNFTTFNPPRLFALAPAAAPRAWGGQPVRGATGSSSARASAQGSPEYPPAPPVPESPVPRTQVAEQTTLPLPSVPSALSVLPDPSPATIPRLSLSSLLTPHSSSPIPGRFHGLPNLPASAPTKHVRRPPTPRTPTSLLKLAGASPHEHWP